MKTKTLPLAVLSAMSLHEFASHLGQTLAHARTRGYGVTVTKQPDEITNLLALLDNPMTVAPSATLPGDAPARRGKQKTAKATKPAKKAVKHIANAGVAASWRKANKLAKKLGISPSEARKQIAAEKQAKIAAKNAPATPAAPPAAAPVATAKAETAGATA